MKSGNYIDLITLNVMMGKALIEALIIYRIGYYVALDSGRKRTIYEHFGREMRVLLDEFKVSFYLYFLEILGHCNIM